MCPWSLRTFVRPPWMTRAGSWNCIRRRWSWDEVQYAPDLLPYIKEKIDKNRDTNGQYLLTGSQNLLLAEKVTESLAGRAAMLRLLPLSRREAEGRPGASSPGSASARGLRERRMGLANCGRASFGAGTRNLP